MGDPRGEAASAPVDAAERDAWVVLNEAEGVGPVTFARLIAAFGTARSVLDVASGPDGVTRLVEAAADADGGASALSALAARGVAAAAHDPWPILEPVRRAGVAVILLADEGYPRRLRRVALPPPVLYVHGSTASLDRERAVAIVGTRRPTEVGRGTAGRIADAVAGMGATIVSGLAVGIDAAAHTAAVHGGRPTVAVIGGGHERLYPAAHRGLARRIVETGGAVISEFAPQTVPSRGTFPRRNRIISGLTDATVVVEAGARSGSLTTAAWALEQGRDLFLVPGRLDDPSVAGCLAFLREGGPDARIVAGIPELLEDLRLTDRRVGLGELGVMPASDSRTGSSVEAMLAGLSPAARSIAREIVAGRTSIDELVAATRLGGAAVLGAITILEMQGLVVETFGRYRAAGPLAASAGRRSRPLVRTPRTGPGRAA
ncbi:MAG TPA: DNA-processing protein DprA [Candidatus Limnocylindrales bacterium]